MWKHFFRFEIRFWLRSFMLWIFLLIVAGLVFGAASSDNIQIGGGVGNTMRNAPFVIQRWYGTMSLLLLLMTTAFVNSSASRDFAFNTQQLIFSTPIAKMDYLLGRFAGSTLIAMVPILGVSVGILAARYMPWIDPERWGPIYWSAHWNSILVFVIPNTIFVAGIIFAIAVLTRSTVHSFLGAIALLVGWIVAQTFTSDLDNEKLAIMLDPFGVQALGIATKYWTVAERNTRSLGLEGMMLWNRLLWLPVGLAIFAFACRRFRFEERATRAKRGPAEAGPVAAAPSRPLALPRSDLTAADRLRQLIGFIHTEFFGLIKSTAFVIILVAALVNTLPNLIFNADEGFGNRSLPVTYRMVEMIEGSMYAFLLGIITFYAGVLVWRERDARFDEVHDALPYPSWIAYGAKLSALLLTLILILALAMVCGIGVQAAKGYTRFQLPVYFTDLFISGLSSFFFLTVLAFLVHVISPNKYVGYFAFIVFVMAIGLIWEPLDVATNMVSFGSRPRVVYSDLYGYEPFVQGWFWFTLYWLAFCGILAVLSIVWWQRGREVEWRRRLANARLTGAMKPAAIFFAATFALLAWWVFYNTKVLNRIIGPREGKQLAAGYEKLYKKYERLPQPRVTAVKYRIDLMPESRSAIIDAGQTIQNKTAGPIAELHFSGGDHHFKPEISLDGARLKSYDERHEYRIYTLDPPMQPGETRHLRIRAERKPRGFANDFEVPQLVQNGSFFNNTVLPQIGYTGGPELDTPNDRRKYKLPEKDLMPALERDCTAKCADNYLSSNSDWVSVETVISTAPDQIAIAPGSLLREWNENGRRFFEYKLDHDSLNFYSFLSARYTVAREEWNVPKMLASMRKSLDYYTANFGPYRHKQARIIEFPRVASFAQAFPGTMPYSESIGFIAKIKDPDDIDMVYYVVAHEMGHQWWAHQVMGANMQGGTVLSETLAQYSSLMVMERAYGRDMMRKFLQYEMDRYLRSRGGEQLKERPLLRVEANQGYIHYQKGSIVLYYLKEMLGEQAINRALRKLVEKWAYQGPPYPTSYALLDAIREETPADLQYLLKDLFEDITLFSNRTHSAQAKKRADGKYDVTIEVETQKLKADARGNETEVALNDWIEVGAFAKPAKGSRYGKTLHRERLRMNRKRATFTFVTSELPEQAGIDPFHLLVDRVPGDNLKKIGAGS
jgi:ABC-2 type transport system permease protein